MGSERKERLDQLIFISNKKNTPEIRFSRTHRFTRARPQPQPPHGKAPLRELRRVLFPLESPCSTYAR